MRGYSSLLLFFDLLFNLLTAHVFLFSCNFTFLLALVCITVFFGQLRLSAAFFIQLIRPRVCVFYALLLPTSHVGQEFTVYVSYYSFMSIVHRYSCIGSGHILHYCYSSFSSIVINFNLVTYLCILKALLITGLYSHFNILHYANRFLRKFFL